MYANQEQHERVQSFKQALKKMKFLKHLALGLYVLLPIFERPAWCINNPNIEPYPSINYWYC